MRYGPRCRAHAPAQPSRHLLRVEVLTAVKREDVPWADLGDLSKVHGGVGAEGVDDLAHPRRPALWVRRYEHVARPRLECTAVVHTLLCVHAAIAGGHEREREAVPARSGVAQRRLKRRVLSVHHEPKDDCPRRREGHHGARVRHLPMSAHAREREDGVCASARSPSLRSRETRGWHHDTPLFATHAIHTPHALKRRTFAGRSKRRCRANAEQSVFCHTVSVPSLFLALHSGSFFGCVRGLVPSLWAVWPMGGPSHARDVRGYNCL